MEEEHEQRMEGGEDVDFREEGDDEDEDEGVEIVTNRSLLNIRQTSGNGTIWSMGGARKNEAVSYNESYLSYALFTFPPSRCSELVGERADQMFRVDGRVR